MMSKCCFMSTGIPLPTEVQHILKSSLTFDSFSQLYASLKISKWIEINEHTYVSMNEYVG